MQTPTNPSLYNPQGIKAGDIVILSELVNPLTGQYLKPVNLTNEGRDFLTTVGKTYEVKEVVDDRIAVFYSDGVKFDPSCHLAFCQLSRKSEERPRYFYEKDESRYIVYEFTHGDKPSTDMIARIDTSCPPEMLKRIIRCMEDSRQ